MRCRPTLRGLTIFASVMPKPSLTLSGSSLQLTADRRHHLAVVSLDILDSRHSRSSCTTLQQLTLALARLPKPQCMKLHIPLNMALL